MPVFRKGFMRSSNFRGARWVAAGLLLFLAIPYTGAAEPLGNQGNDGPKADSLPSLPDPSPIQSQPAQQPGQAQQGTTQTGDQAPGKPVGTAAAPAEKPTGIAGSRPAGAVIAPGKQKRVRNIVIRLSIVAGAAIAVGTVVGLSEASRSRP
jgi:hypothetical protein